MRTQKYTVEISKQGYNLSYIPDLSLAQAKKIARQEAAKHRDCQVFVTWTRQSDGQHAYVNPDGNHAITGQAW